MSTTIRVDNSTKTKIDDLANRIGVGVGVLVARAVDDFERRLFFESLRSRYSDLRQDEQAWGEITAEREAESGAAADDLDN